MERGPRAVRPESRLLGPVTMRADGVDLPLGGPAARLVFASLVLGDGRVIAADQLASDVWGTDAPDTGRALEALVADVRAALVPAGVQIEHELGGFALVGSFDSDVARMRSAVVELDRATDDTTRFEIARRAVALWRGASLGDVRRLPAGERLAQPLDRDRHALRVRYVEAALSIGADVVAPLETWVDVEPLEDTWCRLLARALHQSGRTKDALRRLADARARLAAAGLEPGAGVIDIERRISQADPSLRGPRPTDRRPAELPRSLASQVVRPFAGRDDELNRLLGELSAAASGPLRLVHLVGPPGVGKTALAAAMAVAAHDVGWRVYAGAADPAGTAPFAPLLALAPELQRVQPEPDPDAPLDELGVVRPRTMAKALARVGERLAAARTLVVIDDAQWCDELTVDVVEALAQRPLDAPCLIVIVERVAAGAGPRLTTRGAVVELGPLAAADDVHRFTERVTGVDTATLDVLTGVALLGRRATVADVGMLTSRSALDVAEALAAGEQMGLLGSDPERPVHVWFTHELLREAAAARWEPERTARFHAAAAAGAPAVRADPLATFHHAVSGGPATSPDVLLRAAVAAAGRDLAVGAVHDARLVLRRARHMMDVDAARGVRATDFMILHGVVEAAAGAITDAHEALGLAAGIARRDGDVVPVGRALAARSVLPRREVLRDVARAEIERTLDAWGAGDEASRFDLARELVRECRYEGRLGPMRESVDRLRDLAARQPNASAEITAIAAALAVTESAGDVLERDDLLAELRRRDPGAESSRTRRILFAEALHRGDSDGAAALNANLVKRATARGAPFSEWRGLAESFSPPFAAGDLPAARQRAHLAHERGRSLGIRRAAEIHFAQAFALGWVEGTLPALIDSARVLVGDREDLVWRGALALALAMARRRDAATTALDACLDDLPQASGHWRGFVGIAWATEAAWLCGHQRFARAAGPLLSRRARRHVLIAGGLVDCGPTDRFTALAADTLGERTAARAALERLGVDAKTSALWRRRAAADHDALDGQAAGDGGPWAWVGSAVGPGRVHP